MKKMTPEQEEKVKKLIHHEVEELSDTLENERKEILLVLQFHLHAENLLERIIYAKLDDAHKLLDKANLSFHQKLCLVDSLCVVENRYIESLRKINKLRNNCAHVKDSKITISDIDSVGRPIGKKYTQIKNESENNLKLISYTLFMQIGSKYISAALQLENIPSMGLTNSSNGTTKQQVAP